MSQIITCPSCQTHIDLEKINEDKYKKELAAEFEANFEKEREEMRKKTLAFAEQKRQEQAKKDALEIEDMKNRLAEAAKNKEEMQKHELELRKQQRELEEKSKNADYEMQKTLDEERKKILLEAEQRSIEDKKRLEKEVAQSQEEAIKKQVDEQRKIDEEARKKIEEDFRKKELESFKQQEQMKKTIDDLKRKAEQGSMQIQGDVQEEDLKQSLSQTFPIDQIDDVATGVKGADLLQTVKNNLGQPAGLIVWESKNTKSWQDSWIMKLKDDKIKAGGSIAILVTTTLPKQIETFGMVEDIMVCSPGFALNVAHLLRDRILAISKAEKSLEGKDAKMELLYKYLSSEEFGSKMNMMVDVFSNLKAGIDSERRAMEKNWKKREKDLERATFAVTGMYGELESLMGQELPGAERMSLDSGEE